MGLSAILFLVYSIHVCLVYMKEQPILNQRMSVTNASLSVKQTDRQTDVHYLPSQ